MFRTYRNIPTPDLVAARDARFREVQSLVSRHYHSLVRPVRRELARIQRELDRRSEERS